MADNQYPRMLYAADGRTMTVKNPEEERAAGSEWSTEPGDVHRTPAATTPLVRSDQEPLVEAIAQRTAALVVERLSALPAPEPTRRGRKAEPSESGE